jgi:hypothetical protein
MKVSLNDLVSILASRVGQPFNADLMEEMKVVLNYKRADFFKKTLEQHPEQRRYFYRDFSAELQTVDKAECPVDVDCDVLKTIYPVPTPLRTSLTLFDYVGAADKSDPYGYATPEDNALYAKYNKYTGDRPKYFYVNGYIYVYNVDNIDYINIRGIFPDPRQLSRFKCTTTPCYTDDDQYDIPYDLINAMMADTLRTELRSFAPNSVPPKQGEVDPDKSDAKTEQGGLTTN